MVKPTCVAFSFFLLLGAQRLRAPAYYDSIPYCNNIPRPNSAPKPLLLTPAGCVPAR